MRRTSRSDQLPNTRQSLFSWNQLYRARFNFSDTPLHLSNLGNSDFRRSFLGELLNDAVSEIGAFFRGELLGFFEDLCDGTSHRGRIPAEQL